MNRKDFFKEIGGSLFQTVKSVAEPFIHEDLEKVETAADKVLGITWLPLMWEEEISSKPEMRFVDGRPVIVSRNHRGIQAKSGVCPECSNIITVSTLYPSGKCLNCGKEFNFQTQEGDLQLESLEVKKKDHMYFVGCLKLKK